MKTSELIGPALDWAVAKCEGGTTNPLAFIGENRARLSESWATCGPIIEREMVELYKDLNRWTAVIRVDDEEPWERYGPTLLVAAMRCYVTSQLGDEIEIPAELEE